MRFSEENDVARHDVTEKDHGKSEESQNIEFGAVYRCSFAEACSRRNGASSGDVPNGIANWFTISVAEGGA